MKSILLAALLFVSSLALADAPITVHPKPSVGSDLAAQGEHMTVIASTAQMMVMVDDERIETKDDVVSVIVMAVLKVAQAGDEKEVRAVAGRMEMNCKEQTIKYNDQHALNKYGVVIDSKPGQTEFKPVKAGTIQQGIWEQACQKDFIVTTDI